MPGLNPDIDPDGLLEFSVVFTDRSLNHMSGAFQQVMPKGFFPVFFMEPITVILAVAAAFIVGVAASIFPIHRTLRTTIVDGLRFVG